MDAKAFVRAVVLVLCLVLAAPAVVWLVTNTELEIVALVGIGALALVVLAYLAFVFRLRFWAWFLGGLAVLLTPGLLKLGGWFIGGESRTAMEAWIYVYTAGAVGGLVFELIRGRGGVELPSVETPAGSRFGPAVQASMPGENGGEPTAARSPAPTPVGGMEASPGSSLVPASTTGVTAAAPAAHFVAETTARNGMDIAETTGAARGGRTYIGFLARVAMGGVAASAALVLVQIISGRTDPGSFVDTALRLDTLAGAALVGMLAPALWSGIQTIAESRFSFLKGTMDTAAVAVANAEQAVIAAQETTMGKGGPEASQFIVDAGPLRSPEFIATLAREEDPTEVGKMLLARINSSRIDLATAQAHVEAQLGQALGSLEAAQRVLRATLRNTRR